MREAEKRPSPTYYQILADHLVRQQRSDEAIVALEKAIALDSSDAWSYESMSWALTFNGRAEEGRGYVDAAMRVDPARNGWRHLLAGLAYFSMDRFDEAVASTRKDRPAVGRVGWFWTNFHGLMLGISAYGHLGQTDKVAALRERLDPMLKESDNGEFTGQLAQVFFVYKNYADTERLLDGTAEGGGSRTVVRASIRNRRTGSPARRSGRSLSATSLKDACSTPADPIQGRQMPTASPTSRSARTQSTRPTRSRAIPSV